MRTETARVRGCWSIEGKEQVSRSLRAIDNPCREAWKGRRRTMYVTCNPGCLFPPHPHPLPGTYCRKILWICMSTISLADSGIRSEFWKLSSLRDANRQVGIPFTSTSSQKVERLYPLVADRSVVSIPHYFVICIPWHLSLLVSLSWIYFGLSYILCVSSVIFY